MTILTYIKTACGVYDANLGFDSELLGIINANKAALVQMGLTEYSDLTIDKNTEWANLANETLNSLCKQYLAMKTRKVFDPIPSETISKNFNESIVELEGRIIHEVENSVPVV